MTYILKRQPDGWYVAKVGARKSYTPKLQHARMFQSRDAAEGDRCPDNETITTVEDEMRWGSWPRR